MLGRSDTSLVELPGRRSVTILGVTDQTGQPQLTSKDRVNRGKVRYMVNVERIGSKREVVRLVRANHGEEGTTFDVDVYSPCPRSDNESGQAVLLVFPRNEKLHGQDEGVVEALTPFHLQEAESSKDHIVW